MELQYAKALKEHNIQIKDLPEDAKTGIKEINKALSFIKMGEAKGRKTSPDAIKKIKAMDKWVYYEILDFLEDTDENEDDIPYESDDVEDSLKESYDDNNGENDYKNNNQKNEENKSNGNGLKINEELSNLYKQNKTTLSLDEIKSQAPNSYSALFEVYEPNEENGIETKSFRLIEVGEQQYKLTKI